MSESRTEQEQLELPPWAEAVFLQVSLLSRVHLIPSSRLLHGITGRWSLSCEMCIQGSHLLVCSTVTDQESLVTPLSGAVFL